MVTAGLGQSQSPVPTALKSHMLGEVTHIILEYLTCLFRIKNQAGILFKVTERQEIRADMPGFHPAFCYPVGSSEESVPFKQK